MNEVQPEVMKDTAGNAIMARPEHEIIPMGALTEQVQVAQLIGRSPEKAKQAALSQIESDPELAMKCFYKFNRGGKTIEGPSVRVAEIIRNEWKHITSGARIVAVTDTEIIAEAGAYDAYTNNRVGHQEARKICSKDGSRFSDDMINMTGRVACAIAERNAIFKLIPKTIVNALAARAKEVAIGSVETLPERRDTMFDVFAQMNVGEDAILKKVERSHRKDVDLADLELLQGIFVAIKDGLRSVDEEFPIEDGDGDQPEQKASDLFKGTPGSKKKTAKKKVATKKEPETDESDTSESE